MVADCDEPGYDDHDIEKSHFLDFLDLLCLSVTHSRDLLKDHGVFNLL